MISKVLFQNASRKPLSRYKLIRRNFYKNHYETLNLPRDCTQKDIKDAYIKLSKQYHPDRGSKNSDHKMFVQISEAYNTLNKEYSRKNYDLGLANPQLTEEQESHFRRVSRNPWDDPTLWSNRNKADDMFYESQPYYGISGVNKVSNATIVIFCVLLTCIGVGFQYIAIRNSFTLRRDEMIATSLVASENLAKSRIEAEKNGNKLQIELLKEKMKGREL